MYYFSNYLTDEQLEAEESKGLCPVCKKNQIKGKQVKYCSTECRMIVNKEQCKEHSKKNPLYHKLPDQRDRTCVHCSKEFVWKKATGMQLNYCSDKCRKEAHYKKNKNPLSTHTDKHKIKLKKKNRERQGGKNWFFGDPAWLGGGILSNLPSKVSYLITCIPDQPYVEEDMEEINRILEEELPTPRYKNGKIARKLSGKKAARKTRKMKAYKGINWDRGAGGPLKDSDKKLFGLRKFNNGEREEPVVIDEKESTTDTPTKN